MDMANPEAAMENLREFRHLQEAANNFPHGEMPADIRAAIDKLLPLIEEIARSLGVVDIEVGGRLTG